MRELARPLVIVALVLLVPIVPFLLLGDGFEKRLEHWLSVKVTKGEVATAVVMLLTSDMLLPVPSSVVSTIAGARLGIAAATVASWLGMTLGSVLGFALARWFGEALARRFASREDLQRLEQVTGRFGPLALAVTRPVPILAEATVLLLGATRLAWRHFLPIACLSNLAIAFVYATLGWFSFEHGQLAIALAASIALPLAATFVARWILPNAYQREPHSAN